MSLALPFAADAAETPAAAGGVDRPMPKRHLVGFTFSNGWTLENISAAALAWLNQGALTGAGVDYLRQYSGRLEGPAAADFGDRIAWLKAHCRKDIWPVLYTNTMLGFDPAVVLQAISACRCNAKKNKSLSAAALKHSLVLFSSFHSSNSFSHVYNRRLFLLAILS